MSVEELIEKGASIKYYGPMGKNFKILEIYREKFVLISDGENEKMVDKETILEVWGEEEKKRIEAEQAKNGVSNIEKYFELYGPLNKREHFDQNKDKYPSKSAMKGFSSTIMNKVKPTPNSMFGWNSVIYFLHLNTNHRKNINNYYNRAGIVSEVSIDLTHSHEWCIDCQMVNEKPKLRHSHHWYDKMETEWTTKYENWNIDVEYAFDLFWEYCTEEMLKHFNLEKPILRQKDWLYQDGSKFIFEIIDLSLYGCEILDNGKIRNHVIGTSTFPKTFKKTTTFAEIKDEFRKKFDELVKNPRSRY